MTNISVKCEFCEQAEKASLCKQPELEERPKLTNAGIMILGVSGAVFFGIYAVTMPFLMPALRRICLPFVPATPAQVRNVFSALAGRKGSLIDIGSGDGRIILEAARQGFKAYGVELNVWLFLYSRLSAWKQGLSHSSTFVRKDLWKVDLSSFDNIVIFGVEQMMQQFEDKVQKETSTSCHVVACRFPLPTLQPLAIYGSGIDTVWLYKVNRSRNAAS